MEARELFEDTTENPSLREQLINKWGPLVEGIDDHRVQGNTALLLENQMTHMKSVLTEAMTTSNVAEYTKFIFPLIRNVWPNLISNNVLSVQPMDGPVGAIAYRKARYGSTKGTITAGQQFPSTSNFDTSYTKAETVVTSETVGTGDGTSITFFKTLAHGKITPGSFTVTAGAVTGADDGNGNVTGTGIANGILNYETGQLVVEFSAAVVAAVAVTSGYSYMVENSSTGISQAYADITLEPVRALSRKLTALMSVESAEDMKVLFGADAEADIVSDMASQVAMEIDRENISTILASVSSAQTKSWDSAYNPATSNISQLDHIRTLVTILSQVSQDIYKSTLRRPANWIICSTSVVAQLDQLPEFTPIIEDQNYALGIQKAGKLSGKWTVYSDPFQAAGTILLGYKGNSFADAGFVFAPYIPIQLTPTFFNPANFQMTKGVRTRYASKLVNSNFFGKVNVLNIV